MLMALNVKAQPCKLTTGPEVSDLSLEKVVFPFKGSQNLSSPLLLKQDGQTTTCICANPHGAAALEAVKYIYHVAPGCVRLNLLIVL